MAERGTFLTFEGGEGSGKSTQLRALARRLEAAGQRVRVLREPGGTAVGEAVRGLLLDPEHVGLDATAELLLYEASRAQLVADVIEPALAAGEIVICDRFYDSTTAYQGYARGLSLARIAELNATAAGSLAPDRTIVLDIDPTLGIERATRHGADRLEGESVAFHRAVREGFLAIAAAEPVRVRVIDAGGTPEEVANRVAAALADLPQLSGAGALVTHCVFDDMVGQDRVASFLRTATSTDGVSHAYLFVGPPGAGKATAARALACAVLCDDNGCGVCSVCHRVRRGGHPDVHFIRPEGAAGYLAEQVRDIIRDTNLSPVDGSHKIYIVFDADLFNDSSANAFLKTLEEPPADVVIVLMAHSYDAVLPTIASRCQVVRFRRIPGSEAVGLLVSETGAERDEAAAALAAAGGVVARARDFLASPPRREARALILRTLGSLPCADELEVLRSAKELLAAVKAPLEDVKAAQAAEALERADFLGKGGGKALEERHKRELTSREREGIGEVLNVAESWLRDCLVVSQGVGELAVNTDAKDSVTEIGAVITPAAAASALEAVNEARRRITYNVSPQLAIEAMLFDIREVLRCPR